MNNLRLFPLGLGTGFNLNKYTKAQIIKTIQFGLAAGINLMDTAENYNNGESERIIGQAIKKRRSQAFIATKFAPEHADAYSLPRALDNSLKRLQTDYIDLYQFHWPNPQVPLEESVNSLRKLQKSGKIRYIGVSNFSKSELVKAAKLLKKNLISIQDEFNLLEQTVELLGILEFAYQNNLLFIGYSPLDQGRLNSFTKKQKKILDNLTTYRQLTLSQLILSWLINHKKIIPIPMTHTIPHLKQNIAAAGKKFTSAEYQILDDLFRPEITYLPVDKIKVISKGERARQTYQTLEQAINNPLNYVPSPTDLAQSIKNEDLIKPIRVIPSKSTKYPYKLINGRIRYWAWIIANGYQKPIPALIRSKLH